MWDERDYTARWVQGICAVFLALFAAAGVYLIYTSTLLMVMIGGIVVVLGAIRLCWRCAVYAVTGRKNVNRDDY